MPLALQKNMGATAKTMSLVVSVYCFGIVALRPFSGMISDRFGKKRVTVVTFFLFSLCSIAYLGVNSIIPLLAIRLVHGISHSLSTTSHAAMAIDMLPLARQGEGIGYYGLAMSLAMVIAPALGIYVLDHYSFETLLIVGVVFSLTGWLLTLFVQSGEKQPTKVKSEMTLSSFIEPKAIPISVSAFLLSVCYSSIISFIALYTKVLNLHGAAMYFYIAFALSIVLTRPYIGRLIDQKGPGYLVYPSLVLFAMGILLLAFSNQLTSLLVAAIILGSSYGAVFPSFQTMAVQAGPSQRTGISIATFFLFYDLGFGIGALLIGIIVAQSGYSVMYICVSALVMITLFVYNAIAKYKSAAANPAGTKA
jgi:predicted MFS family arabinose efflux permease